jgi:hypothetical protein
MNRLRFEKNYCSATSNTFDLPYALFLYTNSVNVMQLYSSVISKFRVDLPTISTYSTRGNLNRFRVSSGLLLLCKKARLTTNCCRRRVTRLLITVHNESTSSVSQDSECAFHHHGPQSQAYKSSRCRQLWCSIPHTDLNVLQHAHFFTAAIRIHQDTIESSSLPFGATPHA